MRRVLLPLVISAVLFTGCDPNATSVGPDGEYSPVSLRLDRPEVLTRTNDQVRAVAFSTGGRLLAVAEDPAVADEPAALTLWDVHGRRRLSQTETPLPYTHLAFTPESDELIALSPRGIHIYEVSSWQKVRGIDHPQRSWTAMDLSPDGRLLAAVAWEDSNVHIFDTASGRRVKNLTGDFSAVAFGPRRGVLAAAGMDAIEIFDTDTWEARRLRTPRVLHAGPPIPLLGVMFGPEADYVLTAGVAGRVWDTSDGELIGSLEPPPTIRSVAVSPDRRVLAVAGNDLTLWELPSGRRLHISSEHEGGPTAVAFSPDGETLVTAGRGENELVLWGVRIRR